MNSAPPLTLAQLERQAIEAALSHTGFNLDEAARLLGMGRTTLFRRVKDYGFHRTKPLSPTVAPIGLAELERAAIRAALARAAFNVAEAARLLGIDRTTLIRKVKAHDLRKLLLVGRASEAPSRTRAARRKRKAQQLATGKCLRCKSDVQSVRGPGRKHRYRGRVDVAIPDDFPTDTCTGCGEIYLTDRDLSDLEQRIERRFMRP